MNEKVFFKLEYNKIKEELLSYTASGLGKKRIEEMKPLTTVNGVKSLLTETEEAVHILENAQVPLGALRDITNPLKKLETGGVLHPEELMSMSDFLRSTRILKSAMQKHEYSTPTLYSYSLSIGDFKEIEDEINLSIEGNIVSSKASPKLAKIRKKIKILESRIVDRIEKFINQPSRQVMLQEHFYSIKNDRYVVAIKAEYKRQIKGTIVSLSSKGTTAYIEPDTVKEIADEILHYKMEEDTEVYQILVTLSAFLADEIQSIKLAKDVMATYDHIFARGKYSIHIGGNPVHVDDDEIFELKKARHPLLGKECIPLDIVLGEDYRTLMITGPNTGGKTVALKTLGLNCLMVQSGILPPVARDSRFSIIKKILVDIGDGQNIAQSLSTFSSHMSNLIDMLSKASRFSLVLIDEIGTGTDPREGAALGMAILESFYNKGALTMATTHYGELKDFSDAHKGFENGSMAFDEETLTPLYKLIIGKSGKSNGLWISEKLGLENRVLTRAKNYLAPEFHEKKVLETIEAKTFNRKKKKVIKTFTDYSQGDQVVNLNDNQKYIVHSMNNDHSVNVFKDKTMSTVRNNRLKLIFSAEELYPVGYDMNQLFTSFKERKLEKDITKGRFKDLSELKERFEFNE